MANAICEQCKKPFRRRQRFLDNTKHHFCSRACFFEFRRQHIKEYSHRSENMTLKWLIELAEKRKAKE
jgi:hypothetical protein